MACTSWLHCTELCLPPARVPSQFEAFKASAWATRRGLKPLRTELSVGWRVDGRSVSAGQIDALYVDNEGKHYLFDFKRVAKNHKLDPKEKGFTPSRDVPPACGTGAMVHLPDTHYQKYSLQTSIYNLMLLNTHGIDVGDRMYLLRVHADRAAHELVQCRDLRAEAKVALQSEADRLAALPDRPRPPPSPEPAPAATSPPVDGSGPPASQGSSGARKRPCGAPPSGKMWKDGGWVDARCAKRARTPTTEVMLKPMPRGKPPRGKTWDGATGEWVTIRRGFSKCAGPSVDDGDRRTPLSPRNVRQRGKR